MIISHDLNEMMKQCSTLTVLRDGVIIDNIEKENFDPDDIKQKMVGREIKGHYYRVDNDGYSDHHHGKSALLRFGAAQAGDLGHRWSV